MLKHLCLIKDAYIYNKAFLESIYTEIVTTERLRDLIL